LESLFTSHAELQNEETGKRGTHCINVFSIVVNASYIPSIYISYMQL